ncbi:phage stabilization protein [Caudoviricetes sp.]|nr:phage stabilization protein [Caudoviricetes sp.]
MARANTIQTNFTAGEISPNMYGRVDVAKYFNGARKLRNVIPLPQGGLRRRPGTRFLGYVHDSTKKTIVRTFQFSETDSYVLEFGHQTLRIWNSGATIGAPLVVATPYGENDLADLRLAQSADVIFVAHPNYFPRVITRTSHTSWSIALYDNKDGPYLSTTPEIDLTLSDVVDRATATAASAIFSTSGSTATITAISTDVLNGQTWIKITTSGAHGFVLGDSVLIKDSNGVPEALGAWRVFVTSTTTFVLYGARKSKTSSYTSGGTAVKCSGTHVEYREDNKWKLAQIIDITSSTVATVNVVDAIMYPDEKAKISWNSVTEQIDASNNDLGVFGVNDVYKAIRPTEFAVAGLGWVQIYKYNDSLIVLCSQLSVPNFDDETKSVTITGRTITGKITASAAYFASTDVGRILRLKYGAKWILAEIDSYVSSTVVNVTTEKELPIDTGAVYRLYNDGKTSTWKITAWSSVAGYPAVVSFHQNRVVWFSSTAEPATHWYTKSGDYYDFEPSNPENSNVSDDSGMTITTISRQVNVARWADTGPVLLLGTEGAEWQIKPSSIQQTLTPTNFSATVQTSYGSANLDAIRVGAQTLFVERSKIKVRELSYDFSIDAFGSKDISIISEHILRENGGVVDWANQQSPYSIIWLVLGNGKVASVTYEREHEVIAWALHDFSGTVESVCSTTSVSGEDVVYFVVRRTINGSSVRTVESLTGILSTNPGYLDCSKSEDGGSVSHITTSGVINHLESTVVGVTLDGVYLGQQTSGGSGNVTVNYRGQVVYAGIPITATIGLLDPEGGSQAGTSQGKKKRISESCARVISSYYFKIASASSETNDTENLQSPTDPVEADRTRIVPALTLASPGNVVPTTSFALVSGDITFSVDDAFDNGGRFELVQDEPYPFNLVCLMHKLNTNE